ncbi:MAG TPA: hypothetical protein VGL93_23030 [Streptosporangiaceae bacterium]|jgi:AcrR family transcriptional regulator
MARPVDRHRRSQTLARATDYVLTHGLADLSLRPLASALDTSTRMLLYDFGSKERLISEILAEARRRLAELYATNLDTGALSRSDTVHAIWTWLTAPGQAPYLRLFFQVHVDAMARPDAYTDSGRPLITDWLGFLGSDVRADRLDPTTATLVIATIRGLLLDRFTTNDPARTDQALARFTQLISD